ncbi:HAMP domain-containing sensor histidine kinase [Solirhodobacter olei]|uniref:HAMP domain-containing sensor histidine kinase n=1 Tax=Solirhodobacter olei TaxID=2493082 RepID=UPI000FD92C87|nr:HAMP domain-containing sensor histidine kinase [Solirhodobacter olei]
MRLRLPSIRRSTPLRLAGFLLALFACVSLASFGATYLLIRSSLMAGMKDDLQRQMAGFSAAPSASALAALIANQGAVTDPSRMILSYLAPDGQVYGNAALSRGPQGYLQIDLGPGKKGNPRNYFGLAGNFFGGQLILAESREPLEALGATFLDVLFLSLLPTIIIALGGGLYLARRSDAKVARITATLDRLTAGDLSARVAGLPRADDLAAIGDGVNRMAAGQEASTEALRQVSADIAHDLKTPIQRLALMLDRLAGQEGLAEPEAELAGRAREEAERIVATFQSLLQIAQIEGGSPKARFGPVDLAEVARTFAEIYEPSAEDSGQSLELALPEGATEVSGDRGLLGQALANLIENALRHTPPGSRIFVRVRVEAGGVVLEVADTGPGIPEEERGKVLRRLYRLERSRTTPGSGLGLALVAAIAEVHGAELELGDAAPGLVVRLRFPAA